MMPPAARPDTPVYLSVDFDFFPSFPQTSCDLVAADGSRAPSWHAGPLTNPDENRGAYVREIEWNTRISMARGSGIDIREHFAVAERFGSVAPARFASELARRLRLDRVTIHAADSHRHVLAHLRDAAECLGPLDVLSFDAHHDLGYDQDRLDYEASGAPVCCESWLLWALRRGYARTATIVHPDWLDTSERETDPREFLGEHDHQVTVTTFSDWLRETHGQRDRAVCEMFLARSGWWSPPWCDHNLTELVGALTQRHGMTVGSVIEEALTERDHPPTCPQHTAA